ncbi:TIGR03087 family PEP-CTERM/XrtA system glycosyltransferase [Sphingobium phenoxybenzoativorans]|uniref:TIGR03087 family PEP-CTERM/XrtA system glycosyltransferase n=1 Tax=Sphingobium phenoxybenzoativorans TaxID=1592790 RepID=A0A975K9Z4_9SPHN|nr:TIGR03087 family PEP-CTERM/XrtA system glycosyltransferase [Sphingobium phenoxybenzoativorans]QUT07544.1 TIGR03087 family PEP-CTERM/XrtA system glycosyltransferase [Sphingobium phenoxybenzoativorans]
MKDGGIGEILFLCHRVPFPPDRGDKIRSHNLLRRLCDIAPVHVGCFADDARDMGFATELGDMAESHKVIPRNNSRMLAGLKGLANGQPMLVALFDHPAMHDWARMILATRPISAVVAYSAQMAHFVPVLTAGQRFVMDFVDLDSAKYTAYGEGQGGPLGWINRREGRVLLDFEKAVAARADVSTFVSEAEAALFRAVSGLGADKVRPLENGVALDYFSPDAQFEHLSADERGAGPLLVFTGQMDYRPNIEAVDSFAKISMPVIREAYPDARFAIVGRSPTPVVEALGALPGVVVTGGVPDVRGWLAAADVVVAPLRIARGIQNKVLEAMAMARPVVASAQASEGIDVQWDRHLLVASNAGQEASLVLKLLSDPAKAAELGRAARARMVERYDWSATLSGLPALIRG